MENLDRLQDDVASLPEDAQRMIVDFVQFLKQKHQTTASQAPTPLSFDNQTFVGMWSDLPEMQDSSAWVSQLRQQP